MANQTALNAAIGMVPMMATSVAISLVGAILLAKVYHRLPPYTFAGSAIMAVAAGLFWSLSPTSSRMLWMGYGALFGLGNGLTAQQNSVGCQAELDEDDYPPGLAAFSMVRSISGALFIAAAQSVFTNKLEEISSVLPGFSFTSNTTINRDYLRGHVSLDDFPEALHIYSSSLADTFLISMSLGIIMSVSVLFLPWTSLKKGQEIQENCDDVPIELNDAESTTQVC